MAEELLRAKLEAAEARSALMEAQARVAMVSVTVPSVAAVEVTFDLTAAAVVAMMVQMQAEWKAARLVMVMDLKDAAVKVGSTP